MFTIYKGYAFPISITSDTELSLSDSRLFSHTTKTSFALTPMFTSSHNGIYEYQVVISTTNTALMKEGVYSLELRTPNGYMAKYIHQFCFVCDTAIVNLNTNNQ